MATTDIAARCPYVPALLPGELLYSWIARLAVLNAYHEPRHVVELFFGSRHAIPSVDLPTRLTALQTNLGHASPFSCEDDIVERATLYPYHRPFLDPDRHARIHARMVAKGEGLKTLLGRVANRFGAAPPLRYCPICVTAHFDTYGTSYWQREHQLPGIQYCAWHNVALYELEPLSARSDRQQLILPPSKVKRPAKSSTPDYIQVLFSDLSRSALECGLRPVSFEVRKTLYWAAAARQGYTDGKGAIDIAAMTQAVRERFRDFRGFVHQGRLLATTSQPVRWIADAFKRPERAIHPICHLLLIHVLFGDMSEYAAAVASQLRSAASAPPEVLGKPVDDGTGSRDAVQITSLLHDTSLTCRVVAQRLGMSTTTVIARRLSLGIPVARRPKHIDTAKTDAIKAALLQGQTAQEVACLMHVSLSTVYRTRAVLPAKGTDDALDADKCLAQRNCWLTALQAQSVNHVTNARRQIPAVYAWLYRNDAQWLKETNRQAQPTVCASRKPRINWPERDEALCQKLIAFIEESQKACPGTRLSQALICRQLGESMVRKNISRLPKLHSLIEKQSESIEQHRLRRIDATIAEFREQGIPGAPWRVCRHAGIRLTEDTRQIILSRMPA